MTKQPSRHHANTRFYKLTDGSQYGSTNYKPVKPQFSEDTELNFRFLVTVCKSWHDI